MEPHPHQRQFTGSSTQSGQSQAPNYANPPMHGMGHFDLTTSPSFGNGPRSLPGPAVPPPSSMGNAAPSQAAGAPGGLSVRAVAHGGDEEGEEEGSSAKKPRIKGPSNSEGSSKDNKKANKDRKTRSRLACLACKSVSTNPRLGD